MQHRLTYGLIGRGVILPPWYDEEGRIILYAVDRHGRQRFLSRVPHNKRSVRKAARELWDRLNTVDPVTAPFTGVLRFKDGPIGRGVHSPPWTDAEGRMQLIAVDRNGCMRFYSRVFRRDEPSDVADMLQRCLDDADPFRLDERALGAA